MLLRIQRATKQICRLWLEIFVQIIIMYILFYHPFTLSAPIESYLFKWLQLSSGVLWGHIGRKVLFPEIHLDSASNTGTAIFLGLWYFAFVVGWGLAG